jgi:hypothetical protein
MNSGFVVNLEFGEVGVDDALVKTKNAKVILLFFGKPVLNCSCPACANRK